MQIKKNIWKNIFYKYIYLHIYGDFKCYILNMLIIYKGYRRQLNIIY